jgi:hypothetical protein
MTLQSALRSRYLHALLESPRGRAFVLGQMAEAEGSDEGQVFEMLERRVDDPDLARMIRKHAEDEVRHARMFSERAAATGVPIAPLPAELRVLERLDRDLGGFFDNLRNDPTGVMEAYLLLQVIEERAITQFAIIEPIMREYDPASADVLVEVGRDEERHLKYCHAISRRYAPSEATRLATLARFREVEARAFADHSIANMRHCLDHDLAALRPLEKLLWRGLNRLSARRPHLDRTPFWYAEATPPVAGAAARAAA